MIVPLGTPTGRMRTTDATLAEQQMIDKSKFYTPNKTLWPGSGSTHRFSCDQFVYFLTNILFKGTHLF